MPKVKLDKHVVYTFIMNNLNWFESKDKDCGEYSFLTRREIEYHINQYLRKDYNVDRSDWEHYDPPYTDLNASTLTAMVRDGVMERTYCDWLGCYTYCPIPTRIPVYCVEYYSIPQKIA